MSFKVKTEKDNDKLPSLKNLSFSPLWAIKWALLWVILVGGAVYTYNTVDMHGDQIRNRVVMEEAAEYFQDKMSKYEDHSEYVKSLAKIELWCVGHKMVGVVPTVSDSLISFNAITEASIVNAKEGQSTPIDKVIETNTVCDISGLMAKIYPKQGFRVQYNYPVLTIDNLVSIHGALSEKEDDETTPAAMQIVNVLSALKPNAPVVIKSNRPKNSGVASSGESNRGTNEATADSEGAHAVSVPDNISAN